MRQGFFGAALPGLPGAAVTEGVVTVQSTHALSQAKHTKKIARHAALCHASWVRLRL